MVREHMPYARAHVDLIEIPQALPFGGSKMRGYNRFVSLTLPLTLTCLTLALTLQALPFGGSKMSGYDRFAGPEGLRGLCNVKSVVADRSGNHTHAPLSIFFSFF